MDFLHLFLWLHSCIKFIESITLLLICNGLHINMSVTRPRPGPCLLCGKVDDRIPDLNEHIRTQHSDQTPELIAELMIRIGQLENKL
jgi:hypothetical protein